MSFRAVAIALLLALLPVRVLAGDVTTYPAIDVTTYPAVEPGRDDRCGDGRVNAWRATAPVQAWLPWVGVE